MKGDQKSGLGWKQTLNFNGLLQGSYSQYPSEVEKVGCAKLAFGPLGRFQMTSLVATIAALLRLNTRSYIHTSLVAVRSPPELPVFTVPRGSIISSLTSFSANGLCSTPLGTTYISPSETIT